MFARLLPRLLLRAPRLLGPRRSGNLLFLGLLGLLGPFPTSRSAQEPTGVNQAIDRGVEFLLSRQLRDGSFSERAAAYGSGATALALYALLESGLDADHPGIRRGFAFLDGTDPDRVYTVGLQLLAYGELYSRDALEGERRRHVARLLALLLSWQNGDFGYPHFELRDGSARGDDPADLSNTQFGALGLRAAQAMGLKVPRSAFEDLLDAALRYQEGAREVPAPRDPSNPGRSSTGTMREAGFLYRIPPSGVTRAGKPARAPQARPHATGSMTAAGLTVLAICREGLGSRLGAGLRRNLEESTALAHNWLGNHFEADQNPGSSTWLYYYLYGVERVGALFELERFGMHDWYAEGASALLRSQSPRGGWNQTGEDSGTAFALLFLERATAPRSGARKSEARVFRAGGDVHLIGTGKDLFTLWIEGFDDRWLGEGGEPPKMSWVSYRVDGREVARLRADAPGTDGSHSDPRLPYRHRFTRTGRHRVSASVAIEDPGGGEELVLDSEEFEVKVRVAWSDWMEASARAAHRNLLAPGNGAEVLRSLTTSSGESGARNAVDGLQGTAWVADVSDLQPTLSLSFEHTLRVQEIRLGSADARPLETGRFDRIARARVLVDGHDTYFVDFDADPLAPGVLHFDRRRGVKRLEITLLERVPGSGRRHALGLSEVVLLDKP